MKIRELKIKNFAEFADFECEFDKDITHLVGTNGSGKTTVGLTSIWACLKGIAEKTKDGLIGERFRFIGKGGKSSDIEITVYDEKTKNEVTIKNHITAAGNKITCQPVQDEKWLFDLLNVAFLSAKNFSEIDSKKQALLLGVDTSEYDQRIKALKDDFTLINWDIRNFGELVVVEKAESVDVTALIKEKDNIEGTYYAKQVTVNDYNQEATQNNQERTRYNDELKSIAGRIKIMEEYLSSHPEKKLKPDIPKPDTENLIEQINNAQQTNQQAAEYTSYIDQKKIKVAKEIELAKNKESQSQVEKDRLEYIKAFDFGFDGLNVDPDGNLILNDRPIKTPYFSKGELEIIVARLCMSQNPKLTTRFIDDFELLDEENQKKIVEGLLEKGFQVITAEVGNKKSKANTILLRECKKVEEYKDKDTLF